MAEHEVYFASEAQMRRYKAQKIITQVLLYGFLTIMGLFIVIPFYYMIITSFKSTDAYNLEVQHGQLNLLLTSSNFSFEQYGKVMGKSGDFGTFYLNTIYTAVVSTAFTVVTSVLAAFAFARVNFKGKDLIFTILLGTMMIPGEMMMITNFQTTMALNWKDTFAALIFVHGVSVFYIFYILMEVYDSNRHANNRYHYDSFTYGCMECLYLATIGRFRQTPMVIWQKRARYAFSL